MTPSTAQRNAILAGLRLLQLFQDGRLSCAIGDNEAASIEDIATDAGESLSNDEIDDLCEDINVTGISACEKD